MKKIIVLSLILLFPFQTYAFFSGGGGGSGTDDQTIDTLSVSGNNLQISLEDDGEAAQTVDISTTTTVNTGQGDYELYAMNQDLETTDTPEFAGLVITPTTTGVLSLSDSDSLDANQTIARLTSNATTVTAGAVVSDLNLQIKTGAQASGAWLDALIFDGSDGQAEFQIPTTLQVGDISFPELGASAKFYSAAVAQLTDTTTPSVLTAAETTNKCISNYKSSGADHVFTFPAAHAAGNVVFVIGDEFQVDYEPPSGDNFILNGVAMANDEHIQNTADTLYEEITFYVANINGTLKWCAKTSYANFVEETP